MDIASGETLKRRELVVRGATLELLVADLIHVPHQVASDEAAAVMREARIDRDVQAARQLGQKRFSSRLSTAHHQPTD